MSAWFGPAFSLLLKNLVGTQYLSGKSAIHCKGPLYCTVRDSYWATLVDFIHRFAISIEYEGTRCVRRRIV
jgi:hypothetical protein